MTDTSPRHAPGTGAALRLLAVFLVTAMSALVHAVGDAVPVGQIMVWRSAVALGPILLYMALRGDLPGGLRTRRIGLHLTRSLFGALSMALSFLSFIHLPVATAQALAFLAPVLMLPMATLLLGERAGVAGVIAVALGFGGAIAMLWEALEAPGQGALVGGAAGLGYALTMAFVRVHIKTMTATESAGAIAFYFAVTCTLAGLATWPFGWAALWPREVMLLTGAGLLGGFGHIAATEALARARVSDVAPFDFTGLLWAVIFDLLLFGLVPGPVAMLGALAILMASMLVLRRRTPATVPLAAPGRPGR
ncbi:DMT family transporter [Histidinibacterium aquaticum]|uniref:DMT family transporter n=1 Tax=Histidinibacterium aquaticum TaxID=2613962 RepID=UPI00168AF706|nr:DMT family transporter [Histidinibacterium aquaticum]